MIAQSFVESRMLVEGGWLLLVVFAVKTKLDQSLVAVDIGNSTANANAMTSRSARTKSVRTNSLRTNSARTASTRR
jgi:hypothetical protein